MKDRMQVAATIAHEHAWVAGVLRAPATAAQWRVWLYPAAEIVLGCSQRALHAEVARRAPPGIPVSVRPSGGGAVLAGPWMVGASVVLPPDDRLLAEGLVGSYRWLGELHAQVMREAGVDARAIAPQPVSQPSVARLTQQSPVQPSQPRSGQATTDTVRWACFGSLSPWEVTDAAGRKLTGLAQQRRRSGVAFSAGTLISRPDWRLLCEALGAPDDALRLERLTGACDEAPDAAAIDALAWAERLDCALAAALD
ncbi:MAG: ligase [Burkholderiaceae bacterium]|nr:ligase [Burkholderiaceae bacterium]